MSRGRISHQNICYYLVYNFCNTVIINPFKDLTGYFNYFYSEIPKKTKGEYFWTGIHRVSNTDHFQSADGMNLPDGYNWEYSHPINGIDCVGLYGERRKLLSLNCNTTHSVVCRIGE